MNSRYLNFGAKLNQITCINNEKIFSLIKSINILLVKAFCFVI